MVLGDILYGQDLPQRQVVPLDPTSEGLINDSYAKSQTSAGQNIGSDTQVGMNDFNQSSMGPGTNDAIKQKYAGLLGNRITGLNFNLQQNAKFTQLERLKNAQSALMARTQIQNQMFAANLDNQHAELAARAQAINSILGFSGSAAGMYLGSQKKPQKHKKQTMNNSDGFGSGLNGSSLNDGEMNTSGEQYA